MTTPFALRAAIVATITAEMPAFAAVGVHDGAIDARALARCAQSTPSCQIACLGWPETKPRAGAKTVHGTCVFVAYIITAAVPAAAGVDALSRGDQGMILAAELTRLVSTSGPTVGKERWGIASGVGLAEKIKAVNQYSDTLEAKGVAIWTVTWHQSVEFDPAAVAAALQDFTTYEAAYRMSPDVHPLETDGLDVTDDEANPVAVDAVDKVTDLNTEGS